MSIADYLLTVMKVNCIDNGGINTIRIIDDDASETQDLFSFLKDGLFASVDDETDVEALAVSNAGKTFKDVFTYQNMISFVL